MLPNRYTDTAETGLISDRLAVLRVTRLPRLRQVQIEVATTVHRCRTQQATPVLR